MCIKDLVRNVLCRVSADDTHMHPTPTGFSMILIFTLSGSESQVFKNKLENIKSKIVQQRKPSLLVNSLQFLPPDSKMLIFGLGPLSHLVQLVEKYVCLFVQNSSTWECFHNSSMNTDTFNIQSRSLQLRKIRNSKLEATFKKNESESLGVRFLLLCFSDTHSGMTGMQTDLRTMVLFYCPISIKMPTSLV